MITKALEKHSAPTTVEKLSRDMRRKYRVPYRHGNETVGFVQRWSLPNPIPLIGGDWYVVEVDGKLYEVGNTRDTAYKVLAAHWSELKAAE